MSNKDGESNAPAKGFNRAWQAIEKYPLKNEN